MNYLAFHFKVHPQQPGSDVLIAVLSEMNFDSFEITEEGLIGYVTGDKTQPADVAQLKFDDFTFEFEVEKIESQNWNQAWESNFEPVVVDDLLCVRAPFHAPNGHVKQEIIIMPKMSFGTGHHQTTRLMCREIFSLDMVAKRVLDMGCGTGILAILAKKLGAAKVIGIDIDEWSVLNAVENCEANNAASIIIKKGDVNLLGEETSFGIIFANINKNVLKKQLPHYAAKMERNGTLLLSGFFVTDVEELKVAGMQNGFEFVHAASEAEWALLSLIRK
jgi:ribosomal protein L11 methyltransferase